MKVVGELMWEIQDTAKTPRPQLVDFVWEEPSRIPIIMYRDSHIVAHCTVSTAVVFHMGI